MDPALEKINPGDIIRVKPHLAMDPEEEIGLVLDIWTEESTADNFYRGADYIRFLAAGEKQTLNASFFDIVKYEKG